MRLACPCHSKKTMLWFISARDGMRWPKIGNKLILYTGVYIPEVNRRLKTILAFTLNESLPRPAICQYLVRVREVGK